MPDYHAEFRAIYQGLADELDVPPSKYEEARDRYTAVGTWVGDDDSELAVNQPVIYPQGSFALGTAVRPLGDDDYDVDAVCLLKRLCQQEVSQQELKQMVGDRLAHPSSRYKNMLDPKEGGRRCWTIKYADESRFHLDILPAIPAGNGITEAILITDKTTWNNGNTWPQSNPRGYAEWFKEQMRVQFDEVKRSLAFARQADVEEIEDFRVRTPLQRAIQVLKRHRDTHHHGDQDKPISIIITTLAARSYDNEAHVGDAVLNLVPRMRDHIEIRDGVPWVPNPVNPAENFADKWAETPNKHRVFLAWLDRLESEHQALLLAPNSQRTREYLTKSYGPRAAEGALSTTSVAPAVITERKSGTAPRPRIELPERPAKPWGRW